MRNKNLDDFFADWVTDSKKDKQEMAIQHALIDAAEELNAALEAAGKSRSELADLLGVSRAAVTKLLRGSQNLTIRSMAIIAHVLGKKLQVRISDGDNYKTGGEVVVTSSKIVWPVQASHSGQYSGGVVVDIKRAA